MKRYFIILLVLFLFVSCNHNVNKYDEPQNQNGNSENPNPGNESPQEYEQIEKSGELLFYNNSEWYDEYWYEFYPRAEYDYIISISDKTNSACTGTVSFTITSGDEQNTYYNSRENNNKNEFQLKNVQGKILIHVFPKENNSSSIGTYKLNIKYKEPTPSYLGVCKHAGHYDIKLKPDVDLSVGVIVNNPFYVEKYDGSTENIHMHYSFQLAEDSRYMCVRLESADRFGFLQSGDLNVFFTYQDYDDFDDYNLFDSSYSLSKTFHVKPKSQNDNPLSIQLDENVTVPAGAIKNILIKYNDDYLNSLLTNTNIYSFDSDDYKADTSREYAYITSEGTNIYLHCVNPGKICITASYNSSYVTCAIINIIPENGCYIKSSTTEFNPLSSAKFSLMEGDEDVSNYALWTFYGYKSKVDFDTSTQTAFFKGADTFFEIFAYYQGVSYVFRSTTEDPVSYDFDLDSDLPFEDLLIGNTQESYTINISGAYDYDKIDNIRKCLAKCEKPFSVNMTNVTGLAKLSGRNSGGLFYNCDNLSQISLPSTITEYGDYAFYKCSWLKSVEPPAQITKIGDSVFAECPSLTNVVFGSTLTEIGKETFKDCTSLISVRIDSTNIDTIKESMFFNCIKLNDLTLPDSIKKVKGSGFFNCTSLTSSSFIKKLDWIESNAFCGCSSFTSVEFSSNLKSIPEYAFDQCHNLGGSITIPASVYEIGFRAFRGCKYLTDFYFNDIYNWQKKTHYLSDLTLLPSGDLKMHIYNHIDEEEWDINYFSEYVYYNYVSTGEQCDYFKLWPTGDHHVYYVSEGDNYEYAYGQFNAEANKTYRIFFKDYDGCGNNPDYCNIGIEVYNSKNEYFTSFGGDAWAYSSPVSITLDEPDTLYIKVTIWQTYIREPSFLGGSITGGIYELIVVDHKTVVYSMM